MIFQLLFIVSWVGSPVGHAYLGSVLVPDELGGGIAAATPAHQLHGLAAAQCFARRVTLDVWRSRRICGIRMNENVKWKKREITVLCVCLQFAYLIATVVRK